jgi:hypothetical protein
MLARGSLPFSLPAHLAGSSLGVSEVDVGAVSGQVVPGLHGQQKSEGQEGTRVTDRATSGGELGMPDTCPDILWGGTHERRPAIVKNGETRGCATVMECDGDYWDDDVGGGYSL